MFELLGSCVSCKVVRKNVSILVAGIDNAGKTTVVHGIIGEAFDTVAPTLGFSSEVFSIGKFTVTFLDLGGGERIRDIWKNYLAEVYGVVYVVDSTDKARLSENKVVFESLVSNTLVQQKPILLLANKQDSSDAVDEVEICEKLNVEDVVNKYKCPCRVERCAAITSRPGRRNVDKSIQSGFKWLLGIVEQRFDELIERVTEDVEKREEKLKEERKLRMERVRKRREERERREQLEASLAAEEGGDKVDADDDDDTSATANNSSVINNNHSVLPDLGNNVQDGRPRHPGYIAEVITSSVVNNVQKSFQFQPNHDGGTQSGLGDQLMDDDSTSVGIDTSHHHRRHEDSCTESQQGDETEQQPSLNVPTLQEDVTETLHQNVTITNLSLSDSASHTTINNSVPDIAAKNKSKASKKDKKKKRRKTLRKNQVDPMMFAEAPPLVGNGMPPLANSGTPPSVAAGKRLNPLPVYNNPSFEREKSDLSSSGTNSTLDLKPLPSLKKPNTEDDSIFT